MQEGMMDQSLPQGEKQMRLISSHNLVPMNRNLEPKHLSRALKIAKGEHRPVLREDQEDRIEEKTKEKTDQISESRPMEKKISKKDFEEPEEKKEKQ
jgi:hypothetical protein